jgi:parvulin-like peptidyl-prolyl cis-trans isomerase-like protein
MVAAGAATSACTVTPVAVSVGSATASTADVNTELSSFVQSPAGSCLLQLEHQGLTASDGVGAGGSGTYSMTLAIQVVDTEVGELLAQQFAASKGITVTAAELATAKSDYESILDGEIAAASQSTSASGLGASCMDPSGKAYTGSALLASLPSGLASDRIHSEAIDEKLLARGADLSTKAVAGYYLANHSLFTQDCVSVIVTSSQANGQALVNQLGAGASFSALAQSQSIDPTSAAQGGSLGCNFTESEILQSLNIQSAPVGVPIGPIQDTSTGQWVIYEVTSQQVQPLSAAAPLVRRELLVSAANENRVGGELRSFARHTTVYVNPQYGSWKGLIVVAPTPPPAQYLLAASTGGSVESKTPGGGLQLNGGTGG